MLHLHMISLSTLILIPTILFLMNKSHLLMSLLLLEGLVLVLISNMYLSLSLQNPHHLFLILIMLTLGACEASLGLACLVKMMRTFGNDHISNMMTTQC